MSALIDLSGQNMGGWYVIGFQGANNKGQTTWRCRCACGTERDVVAQSLRVGTSVSCGCLKPAAISKAQTIHGRGMDVRGTYTSWKAMRRRCSGDRGPAYKHYKARGIVVCERWSSFENFLADMGERPIGLTLDRIDNDGNYEPSNCRWADASTQARNQRRNKKA